MHRRFQQLLPFTPLLLLPLLLWKFFDVDQQSLLPWDEGLYMRRARLFLDQNEAWTPFAEAHHKTPGHYWIVALSMRLFGVSDTAARLPFVLLALLSAWLVYEIGALILSRRAGAMASLILGTSYLWAVQSRTISPDLAYTSFFLAGLLLLVQELVRPESSSGQFCRWRLYCAGVLFALTVFLRSALAVLPLVGIMPWLLKQARGRKILKTPWLWLGLACGALPTFVWVGKSIASYGVTGFMEPLRFPLRKATETGFPLSGFPFYSASVFLNFIPWSPLLPFAVTSPSLWGGAGQQLSSAHSGSPVHSSALASLGSTRNHAVTACLHIL
ncbi:MAG: phospholipid carrier-dependent glycosyltransferase [Synechococcus sp. SB0666_bin_14]|nr:phospholipid carrier-dependent glycosyltransferase [Synechococcus sp. SB0666_bin_14]MYA90968.1 phospholipid carrier-dependent glycosyltransferase [Synechococcus sp. SB0663_bin_10]MYG45991.1 phospholipid carrier-dependent glycosyltransferase [Synechococcus sp. SB0675_bin_6]MYJ59705.1 phospholipid carrier-dependent glycosyltransferase [Synechococcus sp. SB0672_bin_6]MYK91475.1 phospholipid carrier-dependent glycosyltransferase [Synechococcus sp. SB0669_bin_8]